jgi:hypothetical protein
MARVVIYPNCNDTVAHLGGVRRTLKHTADEGAAIAKGYLEAHRSTSDKHGHSRITVTRGDLLDYFVNLDDTRSQSAAAAIEYGNKYGGGGIHVLHRAFGLGGI